MLMKVLSGILFVVGISLIANANYFPGAALIFVSRFSKNWR